MSEDCALWKGLWRVLAEMQGLTTLKMEFCGDISSECCGYENRIALQIMNIQRPRFFEVTCADRMGMKYDMDFEGLPGTIVYNGYSQESTIRYTLQRPL